VSGFGSQARAHGLVDELGGLDRAIELIKQKAHIARQEKVTSGPLSRAAQHSRPALCSANPARTCSTRAVRALWNKAHAALWTQGGLLRVMPYNLGVE